MKKSLIVIIANHLRYSMVDINWNWKLLSNQEQAIFRNKKNLKKIRKFVYKQLRRNNSGKRNNKQSKSTQHYRLNA